MNSGPGLAGRLLALKELAAMAGEIPSNICTGKSYSADRCETITNKDAAQDLYTPGRERVSGRIGE